MNDSRRVSVTELVNFCCKQGDLHADGQPAGPSAREGQRAHVRLQNELQQQDATQESEVSLSVAIKIDGIRMKVGGRIDLLNSTTRTLGEIKTVLAPVSRLDETLTGLHIAQLRLYGWLFMALESSPVALDAALDCGDTDWQDALTLIRAPALSLHYIDLLNDEISVREVNSTAEELHRFAINLLQQYARWLQIVERCETAFNRTSVQLSFPHTSFRLGQRDLAAAVYRCTRDGGELLVEAPTGIGKTISTLFPAVKSLGEGHINQVAWLTAKVSGRQSAIAALEGLAHAGLQLGAVVVRSKRDTCFCRNGSCERDERGRCPMTLGFFDRLPAAREHLLTSGLMDGKAIDEAAKLHQLCPFELSLQMLPWVQVVVCDYNYVFDPLVRLTHFADRAPKIAVLVDEAHNFPERARAMYSAQLDRSLVEATRSEVSLSTDRKLLERRLRTLSKAMLKVSRSVPEQEDKDTNSTAEITTSDSVVELPDPPTGLEQPLRLAFESLIEALADEHPLPEEAIELFLQVARYRAIRDIYGDSHCVLLTQGKSGRFQTFKLALRCLDASPEICRQLKRIHAAVAFSATLSPANYFRDRIGFGSSAQSVVLPSVFPQENVVRLIVPWINTRYRARAQSLSELVDTLHLVFSAKVGNYMAFFPSYRYMEETHHVFASRYPTIETWTQQAKDNDATRRNVFKMLESPGHRLGFAIAGGGYAEGMDFRGDLLIAVIVVGTGLPAFDLENRLRHDYQVKLGEDGYKLVYQLPGLSRVLQTTGRLIRSESDQGVMVLIDDRYLHKDYQHSLPVEWQGTGVTGKRVLKLRLDEFWLSTEGSNKQEARTASED